MRQCGKKNNKNKFNPSETVKGKDKGGFQCMWNECNYLRHSDISTCLIVSVIESIIVSYYLQFKVNEMIIEFLFLSLKLAYRFKKYLS